jgi:hypothetical protein
MRENRVLVHTGSASSGYCWAHIVCFCGGLKGCNLALLMGFGGYNQSALSV